MARPSDWDVLDLPGDPTPGDPTVVARLAREWDVVADDAQAAARGVRSLASDGAVLEWLGMAGVAFKGPLAEFPGQLTKCEDSYRQGAMALRAWSRDLDGAQGDADRALALGREARADLESAQAALGSATSAAATAQWHAVGLTEQQRALSAAPSASVPLTATGTSLDPDAVRSAVRTAQVAQAAKARAQADVGDAQQRFDAARRLALQAQDLRESRGKVAARSIDDAADAGIKPNSFLQDFAHVAGQVWDAVIKIAKVVVAVLGIVVLIIGGPLAWVVFAAAVLVMADTIAKAAQGKASGWDVAFAALDLIPGTKGLTTATKIFEAAAERASLAGKTGKIAAHFGGAVLDAGVDIGKGLKAAPGIVTNIVRSDGYGLTKLERMAAQVVHGVPAATRAYTQGLGQGFSEGAGVLGRTRSALSKADSMRGVAFADAFTTHRAALGVTDPASAARLWQGNDWFPGIDRWKNVTMKAGSRMEQGFPGPGEFGVPEGTMAAHGLDARAYNEAVQVSPRVQGKTSTYRGEAVTYRFNQDVPGAVSVTTANPQFGAGGQEQSFVPNLRDHVLAGRVDVLDANGHVLPVSQDKTRKLVIDTGNGDVQTLTNTVARGDIVDPGTFADRRAAARLAARVLSGVVTVPWDFSGHPGDERLS